MLQKSQLPILHLSYSDEHRFIEDVLRREAVQGRQLRILEAGCGQRWWYDLSDCRIHLTGVDRDAEALNIRLEKHHDLDEAILADIFDVHLPAESFDIVYNAYLLEHLDHPDVALSRFLQWLKPGGLLILKIPDRDSAKGFFTRITPHWFHVAFYKHYRGLHNAGKPGYMPYPTPFRRVVSRSGIGEFCRSHGLQMVEERARSTMVDDSSWLFQTVLKTANLISLGRLECRYSDVDFIIRKPYSLAR